jgi:hypothetical protein
MNKLNGKPQYPLKLVQFTFQNVMFICLGTKVKLKLSHRSELYSEQMQSVLSPDQELSLCEIFHSSLTWASQNICITCYASSVKKDAGV